MGGPNISRNQFVLFMEPNFGEEMRVPVARKADQAIFQHKDLELPDLKKRWDPEMSFEKFEFNTYASFAVHEEQK